MIERLHGNPYCLDVWDRLLAAGERVFGHATDDQHARVDRFLGWNMVQWPADAGATAQGIIAALAAGRFVASTGVTVTSIGTADDGKSIAVASDARLLRWIVSGGVLAEVTQGGSGAIRIDDIPSLERTAWSRFSNPGVGDGGATAWSQPFFIERRPSAL